MMRRVSSWTGIGRRRLPQVILAIGVFSFVVYAGNANAEQSSRTNLLATFSPDKVAEVAFCGVVPDGFAGANWYEPIAWSITDTNAILQIHQALGSVVHSDGVFVPLYPPVCRVLFLGKDGSVLAMATVYPYLATVYIGQAEKKDGRILTSTKYDQGYFACVRSVRFAEIVYGHLLLHRPDLLKEAEKAWGAEGADIKELMLSGKDTLPHKEPSETKADVGLKIVPSTDGQNPAK